MDEMTKAVQAAQAAAAMARLYMLGMGVLSKAFYQKYGKEALPIIVGVVSQGGAEGAKMMQQMGRAKSMKGVAEGYRHMCAMMGLKMDVTELSDKAAKFRTSQCPYGVQGTSRELCQAMNEGDRTLMSTFLGQEVGQQVVKSLAMGDKECEVIFSIK